MIRSVRARWTRRWGFIGAVIVLMIVSLQHTSAAGVTVGPVANFGGLSSSQRAALLNIARDTWKFYTVDVDAVTHLPMDNVTFAGGSATASGYGRYTSASNVGVYLWAVVAANDLGLIGRPEARARIQATLSEVAQLQRVDGFLYRWYDTTTGHVIRNPGAIDRTTETTPAFGNCLLVSNVDNGSSRSRPHR